MALSHQHAITRPPIYSVTPSLSTQHLKSKVRGGRSKANDNSVLHPLIFNLEFNLSRKTNDEGGQLMLAVDLDRAAEPFNQTLD